MPTIAEGAPDSSHATGLTLGILSAIGYMVANLGLRSVTEPVGTIGDVDWAIWVSANKAIPGTIAAWSLIAWRAGQGMPALPPRRLVIPLIVTGVLMQWGGNVSFQYALSRSGLALTVPLTFSTTLLSAAVLGRMVLGDPITGSVLMGMGTMMVAIAALSRGTEAATAAVTSQNPTLTAALSVAAASLSGFAYGGGGVVIRHSVRGESSHSATIAILSTTGLVTLGAASLARLGLDVIVATPGYIWWRMLGAGVATAAAFFAISGAYRHLSAVKVTLLNASQAAMAAIMGVVIFHEPNTPWLLAGTVLTILGLVLASRRESPVATPAALPTADEVPIS